MSQSVVSNSDVEVVASEPVVVEVKEASGQRVVAVTPPAGGDVGAS